MTEEDREKMNICPKCGGPHLRIMVTQTVCAPRSMQHNFTRANMRKKEFEHWGTHWDTMDVLCANPKGCGYVQLSDSRVVRARRDALQPIAKDKT